MSFLEVRHVQKIYTTRFGGTKVQALSDVNFTVEKGEYVAIMGESGSGKTTLLNILAALDKPTGGTVLLGGKNLSEIPEETAAAFRRDNLGFVFQDFNLLDTFSLGDNILLPLVVAIAMFAIDWRMGLAAFITVPPEPGVRRVHDAGVQGEDGRLPSRSGNEDERRPWWSMWAASRWSKRSASPPGLISGTPMP